MLQSLYISLSLGLPVIVSPGACGTVEVSLMAYSAWRAGTSFATEGNLFKLGPEAGEGGLHSSASNSPPGSAWLCCFPHPVIEIPLHPTFNI